MAFLVRRWGVPVISVSFASGLQLTGAVEQTAGWVLIGVAAVVAVAYVIVERRVETTVDDHWDCLKAQLVKVNAVRTWLALHDAQERLMPLDEDRVFQWASATFDLICKDFPNDADAFMGGDLVSRGYSFFATAYMDYLHAHNRSGYLEDRAAKVRGILAERAKASSHHSPPAHMPQPDR